MEINEQIATLTAERDAAVQQRDALAGRVVELERRVEELEADYAAAAAQAFAPPIVKR